MARTIVNEAEGSKQIQTFNLARVDDVSEDSLRKKFMKNVDENKVKSTEEIREETEEQEAIDAFEFLGLADFGLSVDDALSTIKGSTYTEEREKEFEDTINNEEIKELKGLLGHYVEPDDGYLEEYKKDPYLQKRFEEWNKSMKDQLDKITNRQKYRDKDAYYEAIDADDLVIDSGKGKESVWDASKERKSYGSSSSGFAQRNNRTGYSQREESFNDRKDSGKAAFTRTAEEQKRYQDMYADSATKMRSLALESAKEVPRRKKKQQRFYSSKKWSFKGMWERTKGWFNSNEGALMLKVGAFLCMETALAIMTKKFQFDGALQAVSFIGMMMGVFAIGRELSTEGINIRNYGLL